MTALLYLPPLKAIITQCQGQLYDMVVSSTNQCNSPSATEKSIIRQGPGPALGVKILMENRAQQHHIQARANSNVSRVSTGQDSVTAAAEQKQGPWKQLCLLCSVLRAPGKVSFIFTQHNYKPEVPSLWRKRGKETIPWRDLERSYPGGQEGHLQNLKACPPPQRDKLIIPCSYWL